MLRSFIVLSVVVVVLAAAATFALQYQSVSGTNGYLPVRAKTEGPTPKVELEGNPIHDFGSMSVQKTGNHSWLVTNKGEADLDLWMISSTCMCTFAKFKDGQKASVKPGEKTDIELEWKTNNAVGDYSKGATIGTNDPARPEFKLGVHGVVHEPIIIMPPLTENTLSVGTVTSDEPKQVSLAIYAPEHPEMKLTKITTSKPDLMVVKKSPLKPDDLTHLKAAKGGYRLDIEIKPGMSLGSFREELVIETDNPDQSKVQATLTGFTTGPISVMPDKLRMVTINSNQGGTGWVTLLVRGGHSTNFYVVSKPKNIDVTIEPNETPSLKGRYRVTVKVPPGTPSGFIDDQIVLHTDHPKVSELKIPVSIVVGSG
jgi:Protein of unknown function (DUF1573)